jgi:cysteine desulfurase
MAPFALDTFGNSSGAHEVSRRAKNALEEARERVAATIGASPMEIIFTSGGTESDNLAIKGAVFNSSQRTAVVVGATEHDAVLEAADFVNRIGRRARVVGVDSGGLIDVELLMDAIDDETSVVSVMMVNNETGAVNDIAALTEAVKEADRSVLVHSDAVQAFGSNGIDVAELGVDMLTLTGHKFGGPKGTGLLYVREGTHLEALVHGGGQELGRRSGTHDVAGVVGLATAMELAAEDRESFELRVGQIRDSFEKRLLSAVDGLEVNTPESSRSCHHLNVRFPGVRNETLLLRLDKAGVAASAGSACPSGAATGSQVLEAMGLSADHARECVRFSFGWTSTESEADEATGIIVDLVDSLR